MPFLVRISSRVVQRRLAWYLRYAQRGHIVRIVDRGQADVLLLPPPRYKRLPARGALRLGGSFRAVEEPISRALPTQATRDRPRPFGFMKGRIRIGPDFDETPPEMLASIDAAPFPPRQKNG